jgi:hypothetical protein
MKKLDESKSTIGNQKYMSIAVSVVREQRFSAQTLAVRDRTTPANPQLHIFPYVSSNLRRPHKYRQT